jgi:glutathione S-transferase
VIAHPATVRYAGAALHGAARLMQVHASIGGTAMTPVLHGYRYSVYLRIARQALLAKGVTFTHAEINPFERPLAARHLALHPFGRVPVLVHGDLTLYETVAITRYVDEAFAGPPLQPGSARLRARMVQIQSVVDSYAYWPLVRQVFSHCVFRPRIGETSDPAEIARGMEAAPRILAAIAALAGEGPFPLGETLSLADLHLAPILAAFASTEPGREALARVPLLAGWWARMAALPCLAATDPGLPG